MLTVDKARLDAAPSQPKPDDVAALVDLLHVARGGSRLLDARIECALTERIFERLTAGRSYAWHNRFEADEAVPAAHWSEDLTALLNLVPDDHDFSLGERDGVLWVWIQPRDEWRPGPDEVRHDHPRGSGLIVAQTLPLAVAAALVLLQHRAAPPTASPGPPDR